MIPATSLAGPDPVPRGFLWIRVVPSTPFFSMSGRNILRIACPTRLPLISKSGCGEDRNSQDRHKFDSHLILLWITTSFYYARRETRAIESNGVRLSSRQHIVVS